MTFHLPGGRAHGRMGVSALALMACAQVLPLTPASARAEQPAMAIEITRYSQSAPASVRTEPAVPDRAPPAKDVGDYLLGLPGVTGGRIGGHGTEITLRGLSQDRIAVINDGSYTFGGCPNRMDPPTATASLESADVITLRRGYQSVTDGPPAPGGTVRLERSTPAFTDWTVEGAVGGGIESNGLTRYLDGEVTAGASAGYGRAFAGLRRAGDYEDGAGRDVRSAFRQKGGGLETGWTYAPGSVAAVGVEKDVVTDALFAGAGMDSPSGTTTTFRARWQHEVQDSGPLRLIEASAYTSHVDHLMDNYSLRTLTAPMKMRTLSQSNTTGGRIAARLAVGAADVTVGLDHRVNARNAELFRGMAAADGDPSAIAGYMWPDMSISDTGLFAEAEGSIAAQTRLTGGLRLDRVDVSAAAADSQPSATPLTARQLYATYYGVNDVDQTETNLSGLLRLEHDFDRTSGGWLGVSRAVRTADASERGIARNAGASSWVGNPALDPERHHQVDGGLWTRQAQWSGELAAWGDRVSDFISRDTARGQDGVLMSNGASVYRNVEALIAGVELRGAWDVMPDLTLGADTVYTWGTNLSDSRPLYDIPPLQGSLTADWRMAPGWAGGPRLRWAATQTRVDSDTASGAGLDARKTPGYAVFDVALRYDGLEQLDLTVGVNNLFDHLYARHQSRSNGFDPGVVQVNEPGRTVYLQGRLRF